MVGVKGLKPSTSRSQTERAINCATPRFTRVIIQYFLLFGNYEVTHSLIAYNKDMKNEVPYPAPDFVLLSATGKKASLKDFTGKWVILYFYPRDDTPGCTVEACSLRDARDTLAEMGAEVVGVSKDDASSHEKFKAKHSLNFMLLTDSTGDMINDYGAWGKKMFGKEGILRKTFIIDPKGIVRKVYGRVTPLGHGDQVIKDLSELKENDGHS